MYMGVEVPMVVSPRVGLILPVDVFARFFLGFRTGYLWVGFAMCMHTHLYFHGCGCMGLTLPMVVLQWLCHGWEGSWWGLIVCIDYEYGYDVFT